METGQDSKRKVLSAFRLGQWILDIHDKDEDLPSEAEIYYFSDRVKIDKFVSNTTATFSPLFIRLINPTGETVENLYRKDLIHLLGSNCGVSFGLNSKRKLQNKSIINILHIDLTLKTYVKNGSSIQYFDVKNSKSDDSDKLAKALVLKYHDKEPVFKRLYYKKEHPIPDSIGLGLAASLAKDYLDDCL
jgi:hypothetical protein